MTISNSQKETILRACNTLKNDTRKSLMVMTNKEVAEKKRAEATELFKKSNAAYILALQAYLDLSHLLHPNLRYRKLVKDSLNIMLNKAQLLASNHFEQNTYLNSPAQESNNKAIDPIKVMADKKPGKQLSKLLIEYTDYEAPRKKHRKKPKNDPVIPAQVIEDDMRLILSSTSSKRIKRKFSDVASKEEEPAPLHKKASTGIKRKVSEKTVNMGIFRKPTNEETKAVLELWEDVDLSSSSIRSSPPQSPEPKRNHGAVKRSDGSGSEHHSPRFWRRQVRKERITESSRSESRTTLKRNHH